MKDGYIGLVIGSLVGLVLLLVGLFVIVYLRHRNYTCSSMDFFSSSDISKSSILVSIALPPSSLSPPPPPPPNTPPKVVALSQPPTTLATDTNSSGGDTNPYATIDFPKTGPADRGPSLPPPPSPSAAHHKQQQEQPFPGINWPVQNDYSVLEYPKETLKPVRKLGEGRFGEVYLCRVRGHSDGRWQTMADDDDDDDDGAMLVVVRMLNCQTDKQTRMNFRKEVMTLTRMKDRNLLGLLGVCTSSSSVGGGGGGECGGIVQEYLPFGDLKRYLQRHANMAEAMTMTKRRTSATLLSYGCLVYLASQIASGMKYLENLTIVHRDLAARNCLVGANFLVKISDLGIARRTPLGADYYQPNDDRSSPFLPVRWMAWEAVVLGKFSTKSDVWSFGVTLWEILSFGKQQPFESLTDDEVIDNCGHLYAADGHDCHLPQPTACPREFYDLMFECWQRDATQRPSFREIHMFLAQKVAGYDPREEQLEFEV